MDAATTVIRRMTCPPDIVDLDGSDADGASVGLGLGLTWAQQRIPARLMGRVISLILFGSMALIPISRER